MSKYPIVKLGQYIYETREQVRTTDGNNLPVLGVTNITGITITSKKASNDLSKYLRLKSNCFAYNPYRINVGSIGLNENQEGIVSPAYVVFTTKSELNTTYLFKYLKSQEGHQQINFYGNRGSVRQALRFGDLCKIEIPLPSLPEQQRIVARIEKLTSRIEEAKFLRRQVQEQTGAFSEAALSVIFPKLEPKVTLRTCVDVNYGEGLRKPERDSTGDFDVFGSGGKIGRHDKSLLDKPFVVVGRKGSVGEITYAPHGGWVIDTAYYVIPKREDSLLVSYLFYALRSINFIESSIATAIPGINRETIYEKQIPVPPVSKQQQIVHYLDKLQSHVNELCKYQAETQKQLEALTQSILSQAFRGKL